MGRGGRRRERGRRKRDAVGAEGKGVPRPERLDGRGGLKPGIDLPIWALIKKDDSWGKQENEFWKKIGPIGANTSKQWSLEKGKKNRKRMRDCDGMGLSYANLPSK